jgi:hypothetical protein
MRRTLVLLALLCFGCSNGLAPVSDLTGTWAADFGIPGASLVFTLTQTDGRIAGQGTYNIEAGRSGTLQVDGVYTRPSITMAIRFDYGSSETYSGTVLDGRHMSGTMADSLGRGVPLTFSRR